jgi:hypothetical protein
MPLNLRVETSPADQLARAEDLCEEAGTIVAARGGTGKGPGRR